MDFTLLLNNPHLLRLKKYIHFILYCLHSHRSRLRSYKVQTSFCFFYVGNDRSYYKIRFCMKQLTRYKGVKFANTPYKMSILHHSSFFLSSNIRGTQLQIKYWKSHTIKSRAVDCPGKIVALPRIFRRLVNGKFDAYVLWPFAPKFQNRIVDRSTARDFTIYQMVNCWRK